MGKSMAAIPAQGATLPSVGLQELSSPPTNPQTAQDPLSSSVDPQMAQEPSLPPADPQTAQGPPSSSTDPQMAQEHSSPLADPQMAQEPSSPPADPQTARETPSSSTDPQMAQEHSSPLADPQMAQEPSSPPADSPSPTDPQTAQKHRKSTMVKIDELSADDIVIAVMGPTGSGKSTLISSITGEATQGIGHELRSFTSEVLAIKFWNQESGQYVVLVDTPGFNDTFKSDREVLSMISDWLNSSYKKNKRLSGILYLHRITDNRMAGAPLKHLQLFRKLCGKDALGKVYLTTTMWDEVEKGTGKKRLEQLEKEYWKEILKQGAHVACCRSDNDSAKKLIGDILAREDDHKAVLLQQEMIEMKKELKETAAGQQLYSQLEILVERQKELLRRINKERKQATEEHVLAGLQAEYVMLRTQVDDKLRQMQELKLSRIKTFIRFFRRRD